MWHLRPKVSRAENWEDTEEKKHLAARTISASG
jgi:hypothetical protein